MGVGVQRERRIGVTQDAGQRFGIYAAGESVGGEGVPLRYNYDKPEKPRIRWLPMLSLSALLP